MQGQALVSQATRRPSRAGAAPVATLGRCGSPATPRRPGTVLDGDILLMDETTHLGGGLSLVNPSYGLLRAYSWDSPFKFTPNILWMDEIHFASPEKPYRMIRFPCKYQQTMVSTWL